MSVATNKRAHKSLLIPAKNLEPHPSAQRRLVPVHAKRIYDNLDLDAIGSFAVVVIDEKPWIIDGQHRWNALMQHGLGDWKVRCEIHEDVSTHADAARRFLILNQQAAVDSFDKFEKSVIAGEPTAVGAQTIAEQHGFEINRYAGDGRITAVNALRRIYEMDDGRTEDELLRLIVTAHGHDRHSVEGKYLEGLALVLSRFNGQIDRDALRTKLAKYPGGASGILGDAKGLHRVKGSRSLGRCVADTILEAYNRGRRQRLEL